MSSQPENITIYSPGGTPLRTVSFDSNAEQVEDLMRADYVQLHWEATDNTEIPAGAYITFGGRKFTLLDPYTPEQADELQHTYTPQFQSRIMEWGKIPYFHYNQAGGSTTPERESDWALTANASTHLASVVAALAAEGQGTWTVEIDDYMQSQGATTISFQATDIFSGLNSIASAFEGEWLARENTSGANGGRIYFARRIVQGVAIDLTVGANVGVPSVTVSKEGYYNRFYVFGSTRNITQDYTGANVNALVNKRLTLDPAKYPGSYIDTRKDTKEPIYSKFLTFDDIYPRAHLKIPSSTLGLRARIMYRIDEATSLPKVIGTNSKGEPVYDQYVVWYFRPVISDTGAEFTISDPTTYDPETNPTGELIKGKTLSVHFSSGLLNGREFELRFVDKNETLKGQSFPGLGLSTPDFATYKGDFEIKYVEEGSMIVPTDISGGVHPQVGDVLTLFNLRMPASYVSSSQKDLEEAAQETIAERYDADLNNYTLPSNQVAFCKNDLGLTVGHAVKYTNGAYSYETRVIRIVRKLDTPNYCEQEITIGSEKIKGDRQTLREDVVDVNRNIEQLAALNSLTETIAQSYARAQQVMLDAIARSADIWKLDEEGNAYTDRNVYSLKEITALGNGGSGGDGSGGTGGVSYFWELADVDVSSAVKNDIPVYNGSKWVNMPMSSLRPDLTGYATEAWVKAQGYLTQHQSLAGYATQEWVEGKGYALASELAKYLPLTGGTLTGPLTMGGAGVHRIYFKDVEHFIELDEEGNFHFSGNVYADGEITALGYQAGGNGSGSVGASSLAELTDVKLSGLTAGDLIQWNGEKFVNVRPSELGISGAVDLSGYVKKTGDTMTGTLRVANIEEPNGNGLITYHPASWTGVSNTQWGVGTVDSQGVIRSSNASLIHYRNGVGNSTILDTGNITLAANATFSTYVAAISCGIAVRYGNTNSYGAMRPYDTVLDVGNGSYARFFRLMHNRQDGNLRFQGSTNADSTSTAAWGTERTLLDTVNYAGLIDSRYVKKAGDEMTGKLSITRAASDDSAGYTNGFLYKSSVGIKPYIHVGYGISGKNNGANIGFCYKENQSTDNYLFLGFSANNELVRLTAAGNVGINAQSPLDKIHVHNGKIRVSYATDGRYTRMYHGGFALHGNPSGGWAGGLEAWGSGGTYLNTIAGGYGDKDTLHYYWYGGTYNSPAMVILPDKKIGIGTTSPNARVHIVSNDPQGLIVKRSVAGGGAYVRLVPNNQDSLFWSVGATTADIRFNYQSASGEFTRVVFANDGKVGIGTTSPAAAVHIVPTFAASDTWINALRMRAGIGTGKYVYLNIGAADGTNNAGTIDYYYAGAQSTSNYLGFGFNSNNNLMVLLATGSLLLGTTTNSSGAKLHVVGTIYSTQESTTLSDRRAKSDIRTLPFRGALIPRTYIKDGRPSIGFIAQEVNKLYPELVNKGTTPDALWSLNYDAITAVLAAQFNEHEDELTKLRRRVADLETEIRNYRRA